MNNSSRCRICLIDNVQMHCIVGTNLHKIYEKLTDMRFEINDGRPLQVCYMCRERLRNSYKLQARCLKSEELFAKVLANNELTLPPFQDIHRLEISQLIVCNIAPVEKNESNNAKLCDDLKTNPLEMVDYVQIKEEYFEDEDNISNEDNTEAVNFRMELKQESPPEMEYITLKCTEEKSDNIEVNYLDMPIKEESNIRHTIIEVENVKTYEENLKNNVSSNIGAIRFQQNETIYNKTQSVGQFLIEQKKVGSASTIDLPAGTEFYKCDICHKCFNHRNNCNDYIRIHTGEKPYHCSMCDKAFRQKRHLFTHNRIHTGEKPYKCDVCKKAFAHRNSLKIHRCKQMVDKLEEELIFQPNETVTGNEEQKKFGTSSKTQQHRHTRTEIYKCNMCHRSFDHKNNYNDHIRIHTGEKPYKCSYCEKSFRQKQHLISHTRIHTGEKPYKCEVCEKSFAQRNTLRTHQGIHIDDKPHICEICGKGYIEKYNLVNHIRTHNNEKPFQCDECEKKFSYRKLLIAHIRSQHNEKPFKCIVCPKGFHTKYYLNAHMRTHTGQKPFKCEVCEKDFKRRSELKTHTRRHTGERPHKCNVCDKSYSFKRNLLNHIRIHNNE